jgi:hypothetical protein
MLDDNFSGRLRTSTCSLVSTRAAAFGNSTGDRQMLEYTQAGGGFRLMQLVVHDDAQCEYAYGPARGLPDTKVGTFTQALYDEAKAKATPLAE